MVVVCNRTGLDVARRMNRLDWPHSDLPLWRLLAGFKGLALHAVITRRRMLVNRQHSLCCTHALLHGATDGKLHVHPVLLHILSPDELCEDRHVYGARLDHLAEQEPEFRVCPCCLHGESCCEETAEAEG